MKKIYTMKTSKFQNTAMERYKHIRTFKKPVYNITVQKPYTLKTYMKSQKLSEYKKIRRTEIIKIKNNTHQ